MSLWQRRLCLALVLAPAALDLGTREHIGHADVHRGNLKARHGFDGTGNLVMQFLEHARSRLAVLENDRDVDRAGVVSRHLDGNALGRVRTAKTGKGVNQAALQLQHAIDLAGSHGDNLLDHATVDGKCALVVDVDLGACLLNRVAGRDVAFGGVPNQPIVSLGLFKSSLVFVFVFVFQFFRIKLFRFKSLTS